MSNPSWTTSQDEAIRIVGRSVAVSAAAGSGKTAVLTERCVQLVCDATPPERCNIDQLAVVTFTDAAASEMKTRIRRKLEERLSLHRGDAHVRTQLSLIDSAHISTLHAFCNRLIRRYFNHANIDPAAILIADDELHLLQASALDRVFNDLYGATCDDGHAFRRLVETYGLGSDRSIARFVMDVSNYLDSLPDPDVWLTRECRQYDGSDASVLRRVLQSVTWELTVQSQQNVPEIDTAAEAARPYLEAVAHLAMQMSTWQQQADALGKTLNDSSGACSQMDALFADIHDHALRTGPVMKLRASTPVEIVAARDAARDQWNRAKKRFQYRLQNGVVRFTSSQLLESLQVTVPFARTLVMLIRRFRAAYAAFKRHADLLDFADLERLALQVLSNEEIAATLRHQFRHVLVDEYQDINPIQHAILQRISRDNDLHQLPNLFSVGDVKQSIYRFRASDPRVFLRRLRESDGDDRHHTISMQENFRSRPHVIDAINLVFEQLMIESALGISYGETERMHASRPARTDVDRFRTELHLLERDVSPTSDQQDDEQDVDTDHIVDPDDPAEWATIEREAYLIVQKIEEIVSNSADQGDDGRITYADCAVLLRSGVQTISAVARKLESCGIPTRTDSEANILETTEGRDLLSLLRLIDNVRQDIPLAAVMRSHILAMPFTEDEMATIRVGKRGVPFHQAALEFAANTQTNSLVDKLRRFFRKLDRHRRRFREVPIHDALWKLLHDDGYLAYVVGLHNGQQRHANLLSLHRRAADFAGHRRSSLHDFVNHLDQLIADGQRLKPKRNEATGNAVSIMTMHAAKGLEFPVVFLVDLSRNFNVYDARGSMIMDRHEGIGLYVSDPEHGVQYPSATSHLVSKNIVRETLAEEVRILYVAMTRAREKLILIGTPKSRLENLNLSPDGQGAVSALDVLSASSYLDFLLPCLQAAPDGAVRWGEEDAADAVFDVFTHDADAIAGWSTNSESPAWEPSPIAACVASGQPLPDDEPVSTDRREAEQIIERITKPYDMLAAAGVRAVVAASESRFSLDPLVEPEEIARVDSRNPPSRRGPGDAAQIGVATHKLMQHLDFAKNVPVHDQLTQLVETGHLDQALASQIDTTSIEWFIATELADLVREAGSQFHREFMFLAARPATHFDPSLPDDIADRVLVRGVADGVLVTETGLHIMDYKTDAIDAPSIAHAVERYRSQMMLYADAVEPLFNVQTTHCHLVFLHPREVVTFDPRRTP